MIINGKRALAYTQKVTDIRPIEGADNIVLGYVMGWPVICKKDEFQEGDKCVYFEIDSLLPASDERFAFMAKKEFKVKTYKLNKFGVVGQGLALPITDFPEFANYDINKDVTDKLGVTYYVKEDNARKAPDGSWASIASRFPKASKSKVVKWLWERKWGKKIVQMVFKKRGKAKSFPTKFAFIRPSDQERCENQPWRCGDGKLYYRTNKCDGTSGTFILERKSLGRYEFYVCSRNVRQLSAEQECFFGSTNYYWEMAKKYDIENQLKKILKKNKKLKYVCVQGEICGPNIQKNPHKLKDYHLFVFHYIDSEVGKHNVVEMKNELVDYGFECVPIETELVEIPDTMEELKASAVYNYDSACCEGQTNCLAEGYVYYNSLDPNDSFKNVSRDYLLKH